jgi:hypothetical protein
MDTLEELKNEIETFVKERDWDQFHSPANIAKSISIESGELLNASNGTRIITTNMRSRKSSLT